MTFARCWYQGFARILDRWYTSEDFNALLEELESEAMTASDHDAELTAIYECAAIAKALKDLAERENIRTPEMVRAINTAVASATWVLDDLNSFAFKMTKNPDGKWVMQGIRFEELKNRRVKTYE